MKPPSRVKVERVRGVRFTFETVARRRAVEVYPDEDDARAADPVQLAAAWQVVANWVRRFLTANPGWKVNGAGLPEDNPV